jgi:hypothetical protein
MIRAIVAYWPWVFCHLRAARDLSLMPDATTVCKSYAHISSGQARPLPYATCGWVVLCNPALCSRCSQLGLGTEEKEKAKAEKTAGWVHCATTILSFQLAPALVLVPARA